jgi:sialidase-1
MTIHKSGGLNMKPTLSILLYVVAAVPASAIGDEPAVERQPPSAQSLETAPYAPASIEIAPVFEAAKLGYHSTRIPALLRTGKATLLAFCEGRKGRGGDWAQIDILARRSCDGGRTWGDVTVLAKSTGGPVSNAVPIADRNGTVHFLFQRDYSQCFACCSTDDGATWSEPRDITGTFEAFRHEYPWKVLAPGPGHGIQLSSGRLLVPVWLCNPAGKGIAGGDHRPSCVATIFSDDHGTTWQRGEIVVDTTPELLNPSESVAVELSDQRVMLNIRSESTEHRRLLAFSADGARGWSKPAFHEQLYEPVCMASLLATTDPETGRRVLLFCNPDSQHNTEELNSRHFAGRDNGTIKLSTDDGKTWPVSRVIDAGPFSYSDLAASPDGTVYCLYEAGIWGKSPHHVNTHVALARFTLRWVEQAPGQPK